ncbi:MAG: hypothetical protein QNK05_13685 [Myxococcota bacterium]|nr:hypothetical protein [Myxococcota bacterium]
MSHPEDPHVVYPQVFTLHWEGPDQTAPAPDVEETADADASSFSEDPRRERDARAEALWREIQREASLRGDPKLWERKLAAYSFVKLHAKGNAAEFARREELNHATVRGWIHEVSRIAYRVGYRLHEDRLLLVGTAHPDLDRLRRLVGEDATSSATWRELCRVAPAFRGEDPYFHLNEGHVLRARSALRASDETLKEGLAIAEARPLRSLLWNARGQTFWDCCPGSTYPFPDHMQRAERAFRRAVILDQSTYFPYVNLAQVAVDEGDLRRAEYWVGELAQARKGMDEEMRDDLARYLDQADWKDAADTQRFWKTGPLRWIQEAVGKGVLALLMGALLALGVAAAGPAAAADAPSPAVLEAHADPGSVERGPRGGREAKGGAGGN